ncbi:hypothetical protein ASE75_14040 [Sphingomonas sp. Leaf17]|uniref:glycoside hydrolase family 95 protein n=1 Tax=Sphingomonas sp. Leaf17 TaxID=1735683 RepID=UPI0006FA6190|nr:glycoside hydrolase family 95 protein [Sphingomonas sp. Leaf17]KQM62737.1 hypothetical protein ASE75_14040 [Sphingomonas sp. Leaf17]
MTDITRRSALAGLTASGLFALPARGMAAGPAPHDGRRTATRLWFAQPAAKWLEALPVGNGHVGAMVFGGVATERLQLNHHALWSGRPSQTDRPETLAALPEVRRLLFAGKYAEANALAQARMTTPFDGESFGSYQMLGDLTLAFDHGDAVTNYVRELDMAGGCVRVGYRVGAARYSRTVLASFPDKALLVRLETTAPDGMAFTATLARGQDAGVARNGDTVAMTGRPRPYGTAFAAHLACTAEGGRVTAQGDGYRVEGARSVVLMLTAATDLHAPDPVGRSRAALTAVRGKAWPALLAAHDADYRPLFDAVALELGTDAADAVPADARLAAIREGAPDPAVAEAYFNFGRYLLIASSRAGSLPANLQGMWADGFSPPWSADYHININLQMNYWPAQACGLGALAMPLFDHAEMLRPHGERTARIAYGCGGAVAHYTSNPWGYTALDGDLLYGLWPEGLAWLSLHFWEHWLYTRDAAFLATRAYPMLRACADFTLDWLIPHPVTGRLVAGPATSPENTYVLPGGKTGAITMGPAMSQSIAYAVLSRAAMAARAAGIDPAFQARCDAAVARLQRLRIGADGRVMEWPEPFVEAEPGHRHISHLFGLFPGYEIDPHDTPDLADAARKTLSARLAKGGGQTGWSAAWLAMFRARLGDGDAAHAMLDKLFREATAANWFDTHPSGQPEPLFQIDGNFGATAAIVEMLMQSHNDSLRFLPALPAAWPDGRVRRLKARGGVEVDLDWQGGRAVQAVLRTTQDVDYRLVAPPGQRVASLDGRAVTGDAPTRLRSGRRYVVRFAAPSLRG